MRARYRFDPTQGHFRVHASPTGMFSMFAHSPTFAARDFRGSMGFEGPDFDGMVLDLVVVASSLVLVDRVGADRGEIEGRMRAEVLEADASPEIRYEAASSRPE